MKKVVPKDAVLIPQTAKKVFDGQIFDVYQWPEKMFDGSTHTFEMLKRPDTVIVVPIVGEKLMIIDNTQPHTGSRLGFPAGRVDETDISTLKAAKREMLEETGYEFKNWRLVKVEQQHKKLEWFTYYYLAMNGREVSDQNLDTGEKISLKFVSFDEVKKMVSNKIDDLGATQEIFRDVNSVRELEQLAEFEGQEINRK